MCIDVYIVGVYMYVSTYIYKHVFLSSINLYIHTYIRTYVCSKCCSCVDIMCTHVMYSHHMHNSLYSLLPCHYHPPPPTSPPPSTVTPPHHHPTTTFTLTLPILPLLHSLFSILAAILHLGNITFYKVSVRS